MSSSELEAEPLWVRQAREVWDYLNDHAELNKYQELIFEGKLTDAYKHVGVSNAYRPRVLALLTEYGVIDIRQRGNKHQLSVIQITGILPPRSLLPPEHLTEARSGATLAAAIEPQVRSLQAWRESLEKGGLDVAEVLKDFELRLTRIERELAKHGKKKT